MRSWRSRDWGWSGRPRFYGSGIGRHLSEAARAVKPLSLHFGDADEDVPFDEVRAIKGALEGFGTTEIYRYPGVGSDFALSGHAGYDERRRSKRSAACSPSWMRSAMTSVLIDDDDSGMVISSVMIVSAHI